MNLFNLTTAFSLFSSVALAQPASLKSVSCAASNGVTLKTLTRTSEGVVVKSRLGLLTENFTAALVIDEDDKTTVDLANEKGDVEYLLDLNIDLKEKRQIRWGTLVRTGDGTVGPMILAAVRCQVALR